jgi:ribosomal protein S18 acetylase RimI-like enzyme
MDRIHMVRRWTAGELVAAPAPDGVKLRDLVLADGEDLGRLLWSGFGSEGQDGFASASAAQKEAHTALAGRWGPIVWPASVLAVCGQRSVAASVVLRDDAHDLWPLLGFLVTDPGYQRRGIANSVLTETLWRMDSLDLRELHLAVIRANPARTLYSLLGFREEPSGTPLPT